MTSDVELPSKKQVLLSGLKGRCPCCNTGKLFKGFIKQVDHCSHCGEELGTFRADDGPAWLSVFITCHIIAPVIGFFALTDLVPEWVAMVVLLTLTFALAMIFLPISKGLFISALWLTSKKKKEDPVTVE